MTNPPSEKRPRPPLHPVAATLRARGFIPLPRLWVKREDMPRIHEIAEQYKDEVTAVRAEYGTYEPTSDVTSIDPKYNKEAAWEAAERLRETS